jgi:glucosamine 6-phosphate synthetase-like amidotransferase/phosphosugar isomerase protein
MGSSRYAAGVAAHRLRRAGLDAVAESASEPAHPGGPGTLAVGISATGASVETVAALAAHARAGSTTVALTNQRSAPIAEHASLVVALDAGDERSGVACRTFTHTVVRLLQLEHALAGAPCDLVAGAVTRAAEATDDLLGRRAAWVPWLGDLLDGPVGTWITAPVARVGNAEQGALMIREVPRRAAVACETGEWSHVDVYLTKTLDYRLLVLPGSPWEVELTRWCTERQVHVAVVGRPVAGRPHVLRYHADDQPLVALLAEPVVTEVLAAAWWVAANRPIDPLP